MNNITEAALQYRKARRAQWDKIADRRRNSSPAAYYHRRLTKIYQFLVPPGQKVLEIGCATGDLLSRLRPSLGVGVDLSGQMVKRGAKRHQEIHFIQGDAHHLCINKKFDVIILSDLVNDLWDVQGVVEEIRKIAAPRTRIIINTYSRLWELPLTVAQNIGLATRLLPQNWLTVEDLTGLLKIADIEVIRHWAEMLWPLNTPFLSRFFNRFVAKIWPFRYFDLVNFIISRPIDKPELRKSLVSVIVPVRNEAGNISHIFDRTPEMGDGTELIFVEGHSNDDTCSVIKKMIQDHPERQCHFFQQTGVGKGDAVRLGFSKASGDILMILDADATVPPEDLPRFCKVLQSGKGEFVNGVRLIYPIEKQAMRFLNLVGNKFFSLAFSWLLGQSVKDTLCGTKVLWKNDYERIAENRSYFGNFDPFGDFDLLFGSARLNLKIVEMPVRYAMRTYGETNIRRWSHGWLLLRMVMFAALRIKFI